MTQQLPIITQQSTAPSPLDAQQFVTLPVVAISDALPVEAGTSAIFNLGLLDSEGPVTVRVQSNAGDVPYDQTLTLDADVTQISVSTAGSTGPYTEYFELTVTSPDGKAYILRAVGTGTIVAFVDYTTYEAGVYDATTERVYL